MRVRVSILGGAMLVMAFAPSIFGDDGRPISSLSLEELMNVNVETVSMHSQPIGSAPAAVSVITAADIRKYGYRTLGEALSHVRGFFMTYDHTYYEVNTGGFSLPGDWSTRILVLIDGHAMPDNIFGSVSYFDEDFAVDMSLVDRIEIVRGPSSALYGSNGILATVNVITRKPDRQNATDVQLQTSSLSERKVTVTQNVALPRNVSLLVSASVFNGVGQRDIYLPEYNSPATNNGHAVNMDGSRGYRFFATLTAGNWKILSLIDSRQKIQPISWSETVFNDRGTRTLDRRGFVDALYTHNFDDAHILQWRTYYDHYDFFGNYHYIPDAQEAAVGARADVNHEFDAGDWVGSQLTYRLPLLHGNFTAGGEAKFDLRALSDVADVQPFFSRLLLVNKLDKFADVFAQQEWMAGRQWSFVLGARYDWSGYRHNSFSPRVAIVYQPDRKTSLKFMYGKGFRNPNANELFFSDGEQAVGNPDLKPERADSLQVEVEHRWGRSWLTSVSLFQMWDRNVIVPEYTDTGVQIYRNDSLFRGQGFGVEISGRPLPALEVSASFQKQHAELGGFTPPNAPGNIGKAQAAAPFWNSRLWLTAGMLYQSERRSLAGAVLGAVYFPEMTLEMRRIFPTVDMQFGVRNLLNSRYVDPIGLESRTDTIIQQGRTWFLTFRSHIQERAREAHGNDK